MDLEIVLLFGMHSLGLFVFLILEGIRPLKTVKWREKNWFKCSIINIYISVTIIYCCLWTCVWCFYWQWSADEHQADLSTFIQPVSNTLNSELTNNKKPICFAAVSLMIFQNLKVLMCIVSVPSFWITQIRLRSEFRAVCDKQPVICQNIQLSKQSRVSPSAGKTERLRSAASNQGLVWRATFYLTSCPHHLSSAWEQHVFISHLMNQWAHSKVIISVSSKQRSWHRHFPEFLLELR